MTDESLTPSPWAGAWLTFVVLAICAAAFAIATGFVPATTRYFPLIISAACLVVALADLGRRGFATVRESRAADASGAASAELVNTAASAPPAAILRYAAWFFGYLVAIWLVSLIVASGLFVAAFLWREAKARWWTALLSGAIVIGLVILAGNVFYIRWPASLLNPLEALF
jgi:hypothetical protein